MVVGVPEGRKVPYMSFPLDHDPFVAFKLVRSLSSAGFADALFGKRSPINDMPEPGAVPTPADAAAAAAAEAVPRSDEQAGRGSGVAEPADAADGCTAPSRMLPTPTPPPGHGAGHLDDNSLESGECAVALT